MELIQLLNKGGTGAVMNWQWNLGVDVLDDSLKENTIYIGSITQQLNN